MDSTGKVECLQQAKAAALRRCRSRASRSGGAYAVGRKLGHGAPRGFAKDPMSEVRLIETGGLVAQVGPHPGERATIILSPHSAVEPSSSAYRP